MTRNQITCLSQRSIFNAHVGSVSGPVIISLSIHRKLVYVIISNEMYVHADIFNTTTIRLLIILVVCVLDVNDKFVRYFIFLPTRL